MSDHAIRFCSEKSCTRGNIIFFIGSEAYEICFDKNGRPEIVYTSESKTVYYIEEVKKSRLKRRTYPGGYDDKINYRLIEAHELKRMADGIFIKYANALLDEELLRAKDEE